MIVWRGCRNSVPGDVKNFHYTRSWARQPNLIRCALSRRLEQVTSGDPFQSKLFYDSTTVNKFQTKNLIWEHQDCILLVQASARRGADNTIVRSMARSTAREKLGKSSNWIQFRQCLNKHPGQSAFEPLGCLVFSIFCCIFLVQILQEQVKIKYTIVISVVSAPEEKSTKAKVVFLMRSQRWGAVLTKAWNAGSCSSKAQNEKVEDQQCVT